MPVTMSTSTSTAATIAEPAFSNAEQLALAGFLAGYTGLTREAYALDLRQYASWCHQHHVRLFDARRADIERFPRELEAWGCWIDAARHAAGPILRPRTLARKRGRSCGGTRPAATRQQGTPARGRPRALWWCMPPHGQPLRSARRALCLAILPHRYPQFRTLPATARRRPRPARRRGHAALRAAIADNAGGCGS
jgi:hypothetical protein